MSRRAAEQSETDIPDVRVALIMFQDVGDELLLVGLKLRIPYHWISSGLRAVARKVRTNYGTGGLHHIRRRGVVRKISIVNSGFTDGPNEYVHLLSASDVRVDGGVVFGSVVLPSGRAWSLVDHGPEQRRIDAIYQRAAQARISENRRHIAFPEWVHMITVGTPR